jgi:hypothetical protein
MVFSSKISTIDDHGILLACFLLIALCQTVTAKTSSCSSNLSDGIVSSRLALSEECFTQHGVDKSYFLTWSGHWDSDSTKVLATVGTRETALALASSGWRLPTIKEVTAITTFTNHTSTSTTSTIFSDQWMVQKWFDGLNVGFIISSSYQDEGVLANKKVMALNLSTGAINAIDQDFTGKSVYVLKVKVESPVWQKWESKHDLYGSSCYLEVISVSSTAKIQDCTTFGFTAIENNQNWFYEENTGFLRSYSGYCIKATTTSNNSDVIVDECKDYGGENIARWNRVEASGDFTFESQQTPNVYLSIKTTGVNKGDVIVLDYPTGVDEDKALWNPI